MELSEHLLKISNKHNIQKCSGDLPEAILMIDLLSLKADFSSLQDYMNFKKYLSSDKPLNLRWYLQSVLPKNLQEIINNIHLDKKKKEEEILNINKLIDENSSLYYLLPVHYNDIISLNSYRNHINNNDYKIYSKWIQVVNIIFNKKCNQVNTRLNTKYGYDDIYQFNEKIYYMLYNIIDTCDIDMEINKLFTIEDLNNYIPQINLINYEYRLELYNKYMENDKTFAEFTETWLNKNWLETRIDKEKEIVNLQSYVINMINNKINSTECSPQSENNYDIKYYDFVKHVLGFISKFKNAETIRKLLNSIIDVYKLKLL